MYFSFTRRGIKKTWERLQVALQFYYTVESCKVKKAEKKKEKREETERELFFDFLDNNPNSEYILLSVDKIFELEY